VAWLVGVLVIAPQRFGGPDSFGMRTISFEANKPVLTELSDAIARYSSSVWYRGGGDRRTTL